MQITSLTSVQLSFDGCESSTLLGLVDALLFTHVTQCRIKGDSPTYDLGTICVSQEGFDFLRELHAKLVGQGVVGH